MSFNNVLVAGGGVLGSQIAFQTAYKGFNVTVYLRSEASVERARPKFAHLRDVYTQELETLKSSQASVTASFSRGLVPDLAGQLAIRLDELKKNAENAYYNIRFTTDLQEAAKNADLVIESVAEDPAAKISFYQELAKVLPEKTIIATNSSSMLPSMFADYTGRPEKYLALHFANQVWHNNTAEIMGHDRTDPAAYEAVAQFAEEIGMVPLRMHKEQPGYILNSLLIPFLTAGQALFVNGVADPATIDLTWKSATGAPHGPFEILDVVGLTTAYNIVVMNPEVKANPDSTAAKIARTLKEYIDAGKTGIAAGEGFYKYK